MLPKEIVKFGVYLNYMNQQGFKAGKSTGKRFDVSWRLNTNQ